MKKIDIGIKRVKRYGSRSYDTVFMRKGEKLNNIVSLGLLNNTKDPKKTLRNYNYDVIKYRGTHATQ